MLDISFETLIICDKCHSNLIMRCDYIVTAIKQSIVNLSEDVTSPVFQQLVCIIPNEIHEAMFTNCY